MQVTFEGGNRGGDGKYGGLSVRFSAVPSRGGRCPRPLGVTRHTAITHQVTYGIRYAQCPTQAVSLPFYASSAVNSLATIPMCHNASLHPLVPFYICAIILPCSSLVLPWIFGRNLASVYHNRCSISHYSLFSAYSCKFLHIKQIY